jgi:hypothetical protein
VLKWTIVARRHSSTSRVHTRPIKGDRDHPPPFNYGDPDWLDKFNSKTSDFRGKLDFVFAKFNVNLMSVNHSKIRLIESESDNEGE